MAKKSKRALLINKLDTMWSLMVRQKGRRCLMCGSTEHLNAHHAICRKAQSLGVRWIPENGVTMCVGCHLFKLHGRQADKAWLDKYIKIVNDLIPQEKQRQIQDIGHKVNKFDIIELEELVKWFEEQLKRKK